MKVEQVYWPWVVSVRSGASLVDAAWKMREFDTASVLVVSEQGALVGIVTERDMLRAYVDGASLNRTRIEEYMTPEPQTIDLGAGVAQAASILRRAGVRHLPVVDGDRPVGVLSGRDLLAALASDRADRPRAGT